MNFTLVAQLNLKYVIEYNFRLMLFYFCYQPNLTAI